MLCTFLGIFLLENNVFQPTFHIVQTPQSQRRGSRTHQCFHLPLQPLLIKAQISNIFKNQMQQFEQRLFDFSLIFCNKGNPVAVTDQHGLERKDIRTRLFQRDEQLFGEFAKPLVIGSQCGLGVLDQTSHLTQKFIGQCRCGSAHRHLRNRCRRIVTSCQR